MSKPILCLDFDGVIHSYERGWQDGVIYGTLTPGFLAWSLEAAQHFRLVVYSSRSKDPDMRVTMELWMRAQVRERFMPNEAEHWISLFEFAHEKSSVFLTIDDRAIQFRGNWSAWWLRPEALLGFRPWNAGVSTGIPGGCDLTNMQQVADRLRHDATGLLTVAERDLILRCWPSDVRTKDDRDREADSYSAR